MSRSDLPARQRQRDGFRRRIPRALVKVPEPTAIQQLIDIGVSCRDKAIRMLLRVARGQRISAWSAVVGRLALAETVRQRGDKGCRPTRRIVS